MFVALVIQQAKRMRHVVLSSVACLALPLFFPHSHKRRHFRAKATEHKICVLIFSATLCVNFFILRRIQRGIIINIYTGLRVKYPLFLSGFNETWIFSTDFRKILRPVGAELFHADARTDEQTWQSYKSDIHWSVHCRWVRRNTKKMQLCTRIYYSKVYWRLNMFRNFIFPLNLDNGRSPHGWSPDAVNAV